MNEFDSIAETDSSRPGCAIAQVALQRLLDAEPKWDSPEAAAHRLDCVACREELALARSFSRLAALAVVPAGMTERVVAASFADRRRRRVLRFAAAGLALAASVVIAVVVFRPQNPPGTEQGPEIVALPSTPAPAPASPAAKPLGESVSEAHDALVGLTRRSTPEPERLTRLLPDPRLNDRPDAGEGLEPLADARTGAARSVEPIRDSARRALNFFIKAADPSARPNVQ